MTERKSSRKGNWLMTQDAKDSGWKVIQAFALACVPIAAICIGYIYKSLVEHEREIAIIKSTRYTPKDASDDRKVFQAEIRALMMNYNPGPLKEDIHNLALTIAGMQSEVRIMSEQMKKENKDK